MLTYLPIRPRSLNSTTPVTLANSVSSLPQPTFSPGFSGVPRCRTMIEPPGTSCPPKTFTPRRCALESRPFFELPKPFLCAMDLAHDVADAHFGVVLPVPLGPLVLLLSLEFENQNLLRTVVIFHRGIDLDVAGVVTGEHLIAIVEEREHSAQLDLRSNLGGEFRNPDHIPGSNAELLSACLNDCVHF